MSTHVEEYAHVEVLNEDVLKCMSLLKDRDSPFHRRMLVRAVLAQIEGLVSFLKRATYTKLFFDTAMSRITQRTFSLDVGLMSALLEKQPSVDDNGQLRQRPMCIPLAANIQLAFRSASKVWGVPYELRKGHEWDALRRITKRRNALMHPRNAEDLLVSPEEADDAIECSGWIHRSFASFMKMANDSETQGG
ncbi:MAG: hypothetical protein KJ579_00245 [Verrucomicrobia bacterium]|nr:hypothetical protein [Verrucomicrobiota bacterium]